MSVPYVDELLSRLGLGPFDPATVTSPRGRNDNWAGTTTSGTQVFVKQFKGAYPEARLARTRALWAAGGGTVPTPKLIGADAEHALLAFEYVANGESGAELAADNLFDEDLCARAGTTVAALHSVDGAGFDRSEHPLPPVALLDALPFARYTQASAAELAMWRLLHGDEPVTQAVRALRAQDTEAMAARGPIHGDMRLDQFLLADGTLYLTDFEEARIGDPARDIGAFAGEWLFHAVAGIPTKLADASPLAHAPSHDEIIATGAAEIEQHAPLVRSFFGAYLRGAPAAAAGDPELAVRAAAYAGWHMLDRMLAASENSVRLSPVNKAAAGIGRTVLLSPAEFTTSLGLEA
ncbi:class IV lanthionine synthetase subunit LxmK [Streptomyces sp. G44]|uniref:class V lanthionine synthetase subunit LxmK n=1 Tax=Streptomyces sp. G44 TaxID=2807632 RepID=UPI00195F36F7|nr:class V lanthionine synthetase subunit LxmK [Streptomyces sp. G44]MBM7167703.1 class IV lanthionine synthetase subunit LxmK [Streptomyces sp. G44]